MLDATDLHILDVLQANARTSHAELARELGMAPSAILERVRKLEQRQLILGYEAKLAAAAVGLGVTAFLFVRSDERPYTGKLERALADIPEVQEVHVVAGDDCYLVKLRAKDTADLTRILRDHITATRGVIGTRTTIVLETVKETATLNLAHLTDGTEVKR
jgi:Lrp/AsnC family leucine-responsive transcriptional regulator